MTEQEEKWLCDDCGHTETSLIEELAGKPVRRTVGEGRREKTVKTVVCPQCGSDRWNSRSAREAFGVFENSGQTYSGP